jgi:hypothetical protein
MPTIDNEAQRKATRRERMRTLQRGDFITLDAAPAMSLMVVDGKPMTMRPPLSEAERKARDHQWWLKSIGPW